MAVSVVGRMSLKNRVFGAFCLFLCLVVQAWAEETPLPQETPLPVTTKRTEIRGFEEGKLVWLLRAGEIRFDREGDRAFASLGIELEVYNEGGEVRSTLKADSAEIDLMRKNFFFAGSVEVVSREGKRILTQELIYRDQAKVVETKSLTQVFFDGNYIECNGLYSDIDFENPEFYEILKGSFRLGSLN